MVVTPLTSSGVTLKGSLRRVHEVDTKTGRQGVRCERTPPAARPCPGGAGGHERGVSAIDQRRVDYDDLGSTVYVGEVPAWATDELPRLYQSCYSVLEYFTIYDGAKMLSTCVLGDPRHIVVFAVRGRTAVVMNQLFDIDLDSATRVVRSIFRSLRRVTRVRFSGSRVDFGAIALPRRVMEVSCDVVIPLPRDVETYLASLGRSTRHKLRNYPKNFALAYPGYAFRVYGPDEIDEALVLHIIDMNRRRMESKGEVCVHSEDAEVQLAEFLKGHGFATGVVVDGRVVAGTLGSRLGTQWFLHVQSFDNEFARQHLGWVSLFLTLTACIQDGASKLHLLWGKSDYKMRLGGVEEYVCAACVYRSRVWRLCALDDVMHGVVWSWQRGPLAERRTAAVGWLARRLRRRTA